MGSNYCLNAFVNLSTSSAFNPVVGKFSFDNSLRSSATFILSMGLPKAGRGGEVDFSSSTTTIASPSASPSTCIDTIPPSQSFWIEFTITKAFIGSVLLPHFWVSDWRLHPPLTNRQNPQFPSMHFFRQMSRKTCSRHRVPKPEWCNECWSRACLPASWPFVNPALEGLGTWK